MEGLAELGAGISLTTPANLARRHPRRPDFILFRNARRAAAAAPWLMGQRRASPPTKCHTAPTARKIRAPLWATSA
eukprot:7623944-Pyramimonas_sp.AAC.1